MDKDLWEPGWSAMDDPQALSIPMWVRSVRWIGSIIAMSFFTGTVFYSNRYGPVGYRGGSRNRQGGTTG